MLDDGRIKAFSDPLNYAKLKDRLELCRHTYELSSTSYKVNGALHNYYNTVNALRMHTFLIFVLFLIENIFEKCGDTK